MGEHYTRNTTGVFHFCKRCNKMTMHTVSNKKLGYCTENHFENRIEKKIQNYFDSKQNTLLF